MMVGSKADFVLHEGTEGMRASEIMMGEPCRGCTSLKCPLRKSNAPLLTSLERKRGYSRLLERHCVKAGAGIHFDPNWLLVLLLFPSLMPNQRR